MCRIALTAATHLFERFSKSRKPLKINVVGQEGMQNPVARLECSNQKQQVAEIRLTVERRRCPTTRLNDTS